MPGILPMKVIKIGSNAQTRIAQACDRCRSKKIRCDGIRPCCTQCANVGFECKTSDKLSRRAFPRGYTESLEERVRVLESEVRELKDLLDEKDEKIDMLSRIHSHPTQSPRRPSDVSEASKDEPARDEPDATFRVRQSPYLRGGGSEPYFAGASSARNFIDAFSARLKELKRADVSVDELLPGIDRASDCPIWRAPPRLISDQLVNIFFQEWAPLFPVVHRPTFLATYEEYIANPESMTNKTALANLNLVFGIAALSSGSAVEELENFEAQWRVAVDAIINENTLETLQSLVLAQIYCLQRRDFVRLSTYKGLATTLSARLGLHQAQKSFALGPLTSETRKKVFWTLYTIDCFSSVALGLPKHIKDEDVSCEMPQDIDDEYVSENGFQPVLPGEFTKLSSALALFKAASILSRVLEEVFPAKGTYELSLRKLSDLSDELELWDVTLPPHLRLHFAQDKPSTGTITSRSPVLSLAYHYIRAMIQRPAITASLGNKASSAMLVHAGSCKRIVQIIQLLEERGLCFAFCFDKDEVLILAGIGLLFQQLDDLAPKTLKDNQRTISTIVDLLKDAPPAEAFRKLVSTFQPLDTERRSSKQSSKPSMSRSSSDRVTLETQSSTRKQLKAIASRFGATNKTPSLSTSFAPVNRLSLQPTISADRKLSPAERSLSSPTSSPDSRTTSKDKPAPTNLDYLSFGDEPKLVRDTSPVKSEPQPTDWERLLGNIDNGTTNIFDACYGGPPIEALSESAPRSTTAVRDAALVWNAGLLSLHESEKSSPPSKSPAVASLFSFSSDEGLISNDEVSATDWSSSGSTNDKHDTLNTLLCDFTNDYTFELESDWQETT